MNTNINTENTHINIENTKESINEFIINQIATYTLQYVLNNSPESDYAYPDALQAAHNYLNNLYF